MRACVIAFVTVGLGTSLVADDSGAKREVALKATDIDQVAEVVLTNEVRAEDMFVDRDARVRGKVIRVVGSRLAPREEGKDAYIVELKLSHAPADEITIRFFFDKADRGALSKLNTGQEVVIQGRCERLSRWPRQPKKDTKDYVELNFKSCKLLEEK